MCRVPGFEKQIAVADMTAAAGPVLAVHRRRFLEIGGYDPVYFPGRIEDLDLGFRGWMAGYRGYYEPRSVAFHLGFGTFGPEVGRARSDSLAVRNSFLFAWKNLGGSRLVRHLSWIPARLGCWLMRGRIDLALSLFAAFERRHEILRSRKVLGVGYGSWIERQEAFFQRFEW
jgi:GT2 family glycosyltransferase